MGPGVRRTDRPGQRGPRPGHVRLRRHEQGRTQPHQDPGAHRHELPGPAPAHPQTRAGPRRRTRRAADLHHVRGRHEPQRHRRPLTREGIPCPSAHDATRNPHRKKTAWQQGAVRAILLNPRYTGGHEVWNKQRKEERLLDVDDVTLGHRTVEFCARQDAFSLAQGGLAGELGGQLGGDGDRLGVVGDHMGHRALPAPAKGTWAVGATCCPYGCRHRPCA
ncbi:recombinase family protein [Streptomyces sp. NPDC004546]|uniref:recombinase family protein n=1 Tax=Streptomyces sp. NPDC004546 TaxID=3154282 RepID=UPI0033B5CE72